MHKNRVIFTEKTEFFLYELTNIPPQNPPIWRGTLLSTPQFLVVFGCVPALSLHLATPLVFDGSNTASI